MPTNGPLADGEKKIIKAWIEAGAPEWDAAGASAPKRKYISVKEALKTILEDLREAEDEDRPYLRYFTLYHLHNNPAITEENLAVYRAAMSKVLNSMHWAKPIVIPRQVDKYGTIYAIDLRDVDWDKKKVGHPARLEQYDRWAIMMQYYSYGLMHEDNNDPQVAKYQRDIDKLTYKAKVVMRADWFVARATRPGIYEKVLRLPKNAYDLEVKLGVDVAENFRRNRVARAGFTASGVSAQHRLVERHHSLYGAYWKSYDFKKGAKRGDLLRFPLGPVAFGKAYKNNKYPYTDIAFEHDGGEMIFNLPNGMQAYYLANGKDDFITAGPIDVVSDEKFRASGTTEIINGLSCIVCHRDGMKPAETDNVRNGTALDGDEVLRKVRQVYATRGAMKKWVEKDAETFNRALREATEGYLPKTITAKKMNFWPEPVYELVVKYYHNDLTAETVAYELGYEDVATFRAELKGAVRGNSKLGFMRTLVTKEDSGVLKRDEWDNGAHFEKFSEAGTSKYQDAAYGLGLGAPRN